MDLVVSDADMVKAESDGYAPDLPSITLDHHQRARDEVCCTGVTVSVMISVPTSWEGTPHQRVVPF